MRMSSPLAVLLMVMSDGSSCHPSCSISGHELVMLRSTRPQVSQRSSCSRKWARNGEAGSNTKPLCAPGVSILGLRS